MNPTTLRDHAPLADGAPLGSRALTDEVRGFVSLHRRALEADLAAGGPPAGGVEFGRRYAQAFDGLLGALFAAACAAAGHRPEAAPCALLAVGSYGRGAVALGSDVDLRFVVGRDGGPARALAEAMLYPLWDGGVQVGHQVVGVDEWLSLAPSDLPTATSLLDARPLGGDLSLAERLAAGARRGLFAGPALAAFVARLAAEVEARRARFGDSVYLLEPDVKNGAGGLRDLDVARWAAGARWGAAGFDALVGHGALLAPEAAAAEAAEATLWRVRNRLHALAGRRSDRLTFDRQEQLAPALGYGEGGAAVERFMSDYYRQARAVGRVQELLLHRATPPSRARRPSDRDLGGGVRLVGGEVALDDPARLEAEPALALRLYAEALALAAPVAPASRDALARAAADPAFGEALRRSPEAASLFVALAARPGPDRLGRGSALGDLHDLGLLVALVPEFAPVVGRVHHDVYHVYTVDVHSVAAVDRLRAIARGEFAGEFPLASRLAAAVARPRVLYLATLLHDVGKAIGGTGHAERGAETARGVAARLGLDDGEGDEIAHLVRTHLLMYHVATRRDLDDPATVAEFVRSVRGREGLRELYLLTVADLSTTSPSAMTSWKAKMLDALYLAADRHLALDGAPEPGEGRAARARAALLALAEDPAAAAAFVDSMPARYALANAPEAILAHAAVAARAAASGGAHVALSAAEAGDDLVELCVAAPDRPGLLALVAAALAAAGLEIQAAQIHGRAPPGAPPQALDLFWVRGPGAEPERRERTLARVARELEALLAGERRPEDLLRGRGRSRWDDRPSPAVATEVRVDHRAASGHRLVEIVTRDRPALLYLLARTLHELGLDIALAKINTEGTRVADVFYVTEAGGAELDEGARAAAVRDAIYAALAGAP
ncbi:MAG TPA: [protein-PII] uridylyltransferase [Polyangiaceae bacterium]|nr:[protein-PII] uridylyltransferase [Polyangiaceae bacterium]